MDLVIFTEDLSGTDVTFCCGKVWNLLARYGTWGVENRPSLCAGL